LFPFLRPVFTSLRLAQQQQSPVWINQAKMENAAATHIRANMVVPMVAPMLSSATPLMTFRKMMNMTVAITVATVVKSADKKVKKATPKDHQRE